MSYTNLLKCLLSISILLLCNNLNAQDPCECTNCPVAITDNGTFDANLTVETSGPNDLGTCPLEEVCFEIDHTWIGDLFVTLTSPSGLEYFVMADAGNATGGCGLNQPNVNVCIELGTGNPLTNNTEYVCNNGNPCLANNWTVPCGGVSSPLSTAVQAPGCDLNAFNVPGNSINGLWVLSVTDVCDQDVGFLVNWNLNFACGPLDCFTCSASGGALTYPDVEACRLDPALVQFPFPTYDNPLDIPDPAEYSYDFVVVDDSNGEIVDINNIVNLTTADPGTYTVCGLSYYSNHVGDVMSFIGQSYISLLVDLGSGEPSFCGDLSDNCYTVTVLQDSPETDITEELCLGDCYEIGPYIYCSPGFYTIPLVNQDGCDSIINLELIGIQGVFVSIEEYVCEGDSFQLGDLVLPPGDTLIFDTGFNGCDSTTSIIVIEVEVDSEIFPLIPGQDSLSCENPMVQVQGTGTVGSDLEWYDSEGVFVGAGEFLIATEAGCYDLIAYFDSNGITCSDTSSVCIGEIIPEITNPILQGDTLLCIGDTIEYAITNVDPDYIDYHWDLPTDVIILQGGEGFPTVQIVWNSIFTGDICVQAETSCGLSEADCLGISFEFELDPPTISGNTLVCLGDTVTYNASVNGSSEFYWSINGGIILSGQYSDEVEVLWSIDGGSLCASGISYCGTGPETCVDVTSNFIPSLAELSGPDTICAGATVMYSVAIDNNTDSIFWDVPACVQILSGLGTNTIEVLWPEGCLSGDICAETFNVCGAGPIDCMPVEVIQVPTVDNIVGLTEICPGIYEYSINPVDGAVSYDWSVSGASIQDGQGTNIVLVEFIDAGLFDICVEVNTNCHQLIPDCVELEVLGSIDIPVIIGDAMVCPDATIEYVIQGSNPLVDNYLCSTTCGTIIGDVNSGSPISVDWTGCPTGGQVCISATGICGEVEISCIDVDIIAIPGASVINGPNEVCSLDTITMNATNPAPDVTEYLWSIPSCATIINGQGTEEIQLVFSNTCNLEEVCVSAANTCDFGPEACLEVLVNTPPVADAIMGETVLCLDQSYDYTITPIAEATDYVWTVAGASIIAGQGTPEIEVIWNENGNQEINLSIVTDCGLVPASTLAVFVQANMETPEITGDALVCDSITSTYSLQNEIPEAIGYTWSTSCGIIVDGQGMSSIDINWTGCTNGGQVCVVANGPCDDSPQVCFDVTTITNPDLPVLNGVDASCIGSTNQYCAVSSGAAVYNWTVVGGQITSGSDTDCVSIEWEIEGVQQLCVQTENNCGLSPQVCMDVLIDDIPNLPVINGVAQTCIVDNQQFELADLEADIIQIDWTISNGFGQITNGQGTNQIEVEWQTPGNAEICIAVENECGVNQSCLEVLIISMPVPNAGSDDSICGLSYTLNGSGGAGLIEWSQISGPGNAVFADLNSFNTAVDVSLAGDYVFELMIDDGGCIEYDEVEIQFNPIPFLGAVTDAVCDDVVSNYTITIEVLSGTAPFVASGLGGTWSGNIFSSDPIPTGASYSVDIVDANNCGAISVTGDHTCPCISESGTYVFDQLELCGEEVYDITAVLDTVLDANDILSFLILSELPGAEVTPDIIVHENQEGVINFIPGMEYGEVYYVAIAVGDELMGNVDLDDPCLSVTEIASFTYTQNPTIGFDSVDEAYCEGDIVSVVFSVSNDDCVNVTLNDGNNNLIDLTCIGDGDEVTIGPFSPGIYNLDIVSAVGQTCQGLTEGPYPFVVNQIPNLDVLSNIEVCNSTDSGNPTTLNLEDLITDGTGPFIWENLDNCPVSGIMPNLDFEGVEAGIYTFRVLTDSALEPCQDVSIEFIITVLDCTCPDLTVNLPPAYCNSSDSIDLYAFLVDETVDVVWSIESEPAVGNYQAASITGSSLELTGSAPGTYSLELVYDGVAPVGCVLSNTLVVELADQLDPGLALPQLQFCEGVQESVDLNELLLGSDTGGFWQETSAVSSNGGGFDAANGLFDVLNESSGLYMFEYSLDSDAPCEDLSAVVEVLINPLPIASIDDIDTITCVNLEVELTAYREDTYVFEWSEQSNLNVVLGINSSLLVSESGAFQLEVIDEETGCVSSEAVDVPAYLEVPIPEFSVTDVDCYGEENGQISILNIEGGVGPYSISFDDGIYSDELMSPFYGAGSYEVSIEDVYGCITNAIVDIEQPDPMEVTISPLFEVGNDGFVQYGDSLELISNLNISMDFVDSIQWTPSNLVACDTCLSTWTYPFETTNFNIQVYAGDCRTSEFLPVFVKKDHPVFVPNVISVNSGNNILYVNSNYMAESVNYFKVYDRWGALVFENYNFLPNDPAEGWDTRFNGKQVESGTYVYVTEVLFIDGNTELIKGDVTVIK